MMMKVDNDDDGDGDNDGERLWWWLLSSDESYISQRSDALWRFTCGDVFCKTWDFYPTGLTSPPFCSNTRASMCSNTRASAALWCKLFWTTFCKHV